MNKPNVILMLADDLGIGDLSCYNPDSRLNTEHLDQLAAEGLRCSDAHASSALCTPSRYGLLTGRYNWRSRLKKMVLPGHCPHLIEDNRLTLGSLFKKAGYQTAAVGKWHLGMDWAMKEEPETYGYDEQELLKNRVRPEGLRIDFTRPVENGPNAFGFDYCYVTPGSLDISPYVFLENDRLTERPTRISGSSEFWPTKNTGTGAEVPYMSCWPLGATAPDYIHQNVVPDSADRILGLMEKYAADEKPFFLYYPIHAPHVPCIPTPEFEGKSGLGPYGDMVLMIDDIAGRIMAKTDELGITDNTIFIFTSDNGSEHAFPEFGHSSNYIYRGFKSDIWDGGHRIPYLVRYPGHIAPGSVTDQTVCLTDLMATFADILGYTLADNEGEDSVSNLSLWEGNDQPLREYTIHHSGNGMFGIRKGNWKLELCPDGGGFRKPGQSVDETLPPIQLYDMENDVRETTNVADRYPGVVKELTEELTKQVVNGRSTPGTPQKNTGPVWWPEINWIKEEEMTAAC